MRVAGLHITGFRGLDGWFPLAHPVAVLVGENNAGKSAVIDALRLVLLPAEGTRPWVTDADFTRPPEGSRTNDRFTITVKLEGLDRTQAGRLSSCLTSRDTASICLTASIESDDRIRLRWGGGDLGTNDIEELAREEVSYVFLPALRDAQSDLAPGRSSRLARVLSGITRDDNERQQLEDIVRRANEQLADVRVVERARGGIQGRLDDILGPAFAQMSDLRFSDPVFDRIIRNLRALIGTSEPREMAESGLGYNNILYIAAVLAGMEQAGEGLNVLLVEEPEAHLHPQLQRLLMRFLEATAGRGDRTQVIVTTHSPNLASAPPIQRTTVLHRNEGVTTARAIGSLDITAADFDHLHRFLDATRAGLLFSRGVLLVEGLAEQLLVPEIALSLGIDLAETGVEVVNVGGLAFRQFAQLFGEDRLPIRCALITDSDPHWQVPDEPSDEIASAEGKSPAARRIEELQSRLVRPFFAQRTFEWDLIEAGNWDLALDALAEIRPRKTSSLREDFAAASESERADAFLEAVKPRYKSRFAQALARHLASRRAADPTTGDTGTDAFDSGYERPRKFSVPEYLRNAFEWLTAGQATLGDSRDLSDQASPTTDDPATRPSARAPR